jgi:hypothetical protein
MSQDPFINQRVDRVQENKPLIGYSGVSTRASELVNSKLPYGVTGLYGTTEAQFGMSEFVVKYKTGGSGIYGFNNVRDGSGVLGECRGKQGNGILGVNYGGGSGVAGISLAENGIGLYGKGSAYAGQFEGNVDVTGHLWVKNIEVSNITVTGDIHMVNADFAENFDVFESINDTIDAGTVMVIVSEEALQPCSQPYDKRVAGVVSGAGKYKPAMILDSKLSNHHRLPIALMGKVICKVDSSFGDIELGDLLTTSSTPGHAMKIQDSAKGFGTVIGKALAPYKDGKGLIPILVALQ